MIVRRGLHAEGYRFRVQGSGLPGRPDLVLRRYHVVVFVHGCFWHGHDCPMFRLPRTRSDFWEAKITSNQQRDTKAVQMLLAQGWRVAIIWTCSLKGPNRLTSAIVIERCIRFLQASDQKVIEIAGQFP